MTWIKSAPCDTPLPPPDLADRPEAALAAAPAARAAMPRSAGRLHPIYAPWKVEALARLPSYLASGGRSLRGFAEACDASIVDWEVAACDPFANCNTPDELAALEPAWWGHRGSNPDGRSPSDFKSHAPAIIG